MSQWRCRHGIMHSHHDASNRCSACVAVEQEMLSSIKQNFDSSGQYQLSGTFGKSNLLALIEDRLANLKATDPSDTGNAYIAGQRDALTGLRDALLGMESQ